MLDNIIIGKYYPVRSRVHLMNPLSKIICTMIFIIMSVCAGNLQLNLALLAIALFMILNSNIPIKYFFSTIKSLRFIILFTIIINFLFNVYFEITLVMIFRIILIVLYTSVLTLTTPPTEITYGLEKFLSPLKVFRLPINKMALTISIALRFIPTIIDQANKILKSQASRGIDYYNSGIKGRFIAIKSLIIPMFILTLKKADDLADSMTIRLFSIHQTRTNYRINKWGLYDTFLVSSHILLLVGFFTRGMFL